MISAEEIKALMAKKFLAESCKHFFENYYTKDMIRAGAWEEDNLPEWETWAIATDDEEHGDRCSMIYLVQYFISESPAILTLQTLLNQAAEALKYITHDTEFVISQLKKLKYETNGGVIESHYNTASEALAAIEPYLTKEGE